MSTVKISQLPNIPGGLNANTSNSLFLGVDIPTGITGKFTATQLAERLYANNVLNVGDNPIVFPNVVAQFAGDSSEYLQLNLLNSTAEGSVDYVATADTGTDTTHYVDLGINNSNYGSHELDGYLIVAGGSTPTQPGGNLMMGSITSSKRIDFVIGGVEESNVVAKMIDGTGLKLTKKPLIYADGTSQNSASIGIDYSLASYGQANIAYNFAAAANSMAFSAYASGNTNSDNIIKVNTYANSAYAKANAALANASGTFAGDLNITGTLKSAGIVTLNNSTFATNTAFLSIVASDDFVVVPPSNTNYMIHVTGKANSVTRVVLDSFGANTYPAFIGRMGRGSASSVLPTQNNDVMLRIVGNGYTGTQFPGSSPTKIDFAAAENFSDTNRGSRIEFWNTPIGSNVIQKIATFNANEVSFSGTVTPAKGFTFVPRVPAGNQTAITIDYSVDSIIKANLIADLVISHTNYIAGKVVEIWLTNNDNANRTVTHGCAALRSTNKSTTFTITAQSSAYMRFFSIDGDNANTFVSIIA